MDKPRHEYCASGKCEQGAEIAKKFPKWKPGERPTPTWPAPVEPVEQLKREVAELVLKRKKPTWREWKEQKDRDRAQEPAPELDQVEHEPHPLSNRGMEGSMEGKRPCTTTGCKQQITHYNKSGKCRWCSGGIPLDSAAHGRPQAPRNGKPQLAGIRGATAIESRRKEIPGVKSSAAPSLAGQDEFDLMISIRDSFRKLSEPARRYVLEALK